MVDHTPDTAHRGMARPRTPARHPAQERALRDRRTWRRLSPSQRAALFGHRPEQRKPPLGQRQMTLDEL